jgi:gibberellin A4 carboxyl methyltransferase
MSAEDEDPTETEGQSEGAAAQPVTSGMVGHGFYNRHSAPQWAAIAHVLPWLDAVAASLHLAKTPPTTVGLADFGCSEGRNSIAVMQRLVVALRQRTSRPIQTIHSDLPTNDYSELFRGLRPQDQSVFASPETYSAAVGGSMFEQLLPPRSIHVATTFNAIGFLSRRPVDRLPNYILPNGPSARRGNGSVSPADRRAFAAQALDDVDTFLRARAAELVPGGKLLVQVFGCGDRLRTCDGIYDALNDAMLEVVDAGLVDRGSYESFYQPVYFRTLDELTASVAAPDAPLFDLERAETYEVTVPFVEAFRRTGDRAPFAKDYTDFFRAFTEPVLRIGFAAHPQLDRLVGEVYARAERLIRDDPDRYEFHYIAVAMLLTRQEPFGAQSGGK